MPYDLRYELLEKIEEYILEHIANEYNTSLFE